MEIKREGEMREIIKRTANGGYICPLCNRIIKDPTVCCPHCTSKCQEIIERPNGTQCKHEKYSDQGEQGWCCDTCGAQVVMFKQWSAGESAGKSGNPESDNPNAQGTHAWFSWLAGHQDA